MPDKDKPVEAASAAPGEKRAATPPSAKAPLARASESGDPEVQKALGDLYTAQQNLAAVRAAQAANPAAEAAERHARDRLAELGYE